MNCNISQRVDSILDNAINCVKAFRTGDGAKGYEKITEFIENLQSLVAEVEKEDDSKQKISSIIVEMNEAFKQINNALSNKDNVMISDLMEYEIIPKIQSIKSLF